MLKKVFRLNENEIKKVLKASKPFFSYWITVSFKKTTTNNNKFWIVIGSKSVKNNVHRVFFRRMFYDIVWDKIYSSSNFDCVFIVKKQFKLDKNDENIVKSFQNDINFLIYKINL